MTDHDELPMTRKSTRANDHAYVEIRGLILSGEAAPGEQLKEEHLAELCGVSRTPVRDALRRLEAELYVVRSDSKRAYVADWGRADVDEMFTLRGMLEAHAAERAATRLGREGIAQLRVCNQEILTVISGAQPDIAAFLACNRTFHQVIVNAAQSRRLAGILATLVEQPIVRRTAIRYDRDQLERSAREHDELIHAFEAGDADWARSVMSGHIRRAYHVFVRTLARTDR